MKAVIFRYELAKIFKAPAIWAFVIAAIAFNALHSDKISLHHNIGEIYTYDVHAVVFGNYARLLFFETAVLSIMIMLFIMGYEQIARTASAVYATKTGRKLTAKKCLAAYTAGCVCFTVMYIFSWIIMLSKMDFSLVWNQSLSLQGNVITTDFFGWTAVNWKNITVAQFFAGSVAISFLLNMIFIALAMPFAVLNKNAYSSFWFLIGIAFLNFFLMKAFPELDLLHSIAKMTPLGLAFNNHIWFTDGGSYFFLPQFETVITAFYLIISSLFIIATLKLFKRKDLI